MFRWASCSPAHRSGCQASSQTRSAVLSTMLLVKEVTQFLSCRFCSQCAALPTWSRTYIGTGAWLQLGSKHVVGLSWVRSTQLASQSCTILYYIEHMLSSYVVSAPLSCCTCTAQCMCMPVLLHECCTIMARASGYPAVGWQRVIRCVSFTAPLRGKTHFLQCVAVQLVL
jgi:hypothetical protein